MNLLMFWKNPEFLRHRRSELRTNRAITVLAVVLVICVLIWLGCWVSQGDQMASYRYRAQHFGNPSPARLSQLERELPTATWLDFYRILIYGQLAILTFWSLLCCAQAISGERERKTWDFQRATSLTPGGFLIGKLLGEPVVAYFIVLCTLPITIIAAWQGHAGIANILSAYVLILSAALFIGIVGLWLSNLFETRSRGIGLIGTIGLYVFLGFSYAWIDSSFPGFAAFSPIAEITRLVDASGQDRGATIFGVPVPWLAMSLILYTSFGAWFVLMILRSLKKDFDQIKQLSRWQAVACAAFLNFTVYALFRPGPLLEGRQTPLQGANFVTVMVIINAFILFAMGLAMISPHDHLKIWWRQRSGFESLLAEDSPPLPWLVVSATTAYILLMWGMFAWKNDVGFDARALLSGLLQSVTILIYVTRDILFLQWCRLTKMRAPVLKGFLYLALYYIAAVVLTVVFGAQDHYTRGQAVMALLTPAGAFEIGPAKTATLPEVVAGLVIQVAAIIFIMAATANKLKRATTAAHPA
ncbi:MAG: hypothetical protein WBV36_14590 [Terriglobales bacterium]